MDTTSENKKIALFIDCENISYKLCDEIMKRLNEIGEVCIRKAYGDWRKEALHSWVGLLLQYSIEPIQILTGNRQDDGDRRGKNSSDIKLTIDVVNTLYSRNIDYIALATSDSDFAPLAQEIRKWAIPAIGFGTKNARDELKQSFNSYDELDEQHTLSANKALIKLLHKAIEQNQDRESYALVSRIGNWIKENYYKSASSYGEESWGDIFKQLKNEFELNYRGARNSVMSVRIKRENK